MSSRWHLKVKYCNLCIGLILGFSSTILCAFLRVLLTYLMFHASRLMMLLMVEFFFFCTQYLFAVKCHQCVFLCGVRAHLLCLQIP